MCFATAFELTLITCHGCFCECVWWQIATLYWYCDEDECPYCAAADAVRASAGAPKTPSGTTTAAVTRTSAAERPVGRNLTIRPPRRFGTYIV
jgi:hypothetical protein